MMEKQNRTMVRKEADGDASEVDDIVDFAAKKMDKIRSAGPAHSRSRSPYKEEAVSDAVIGCAS